MAQPRGVPASHEVRAVAWAGVVAGVALAVLGGVAQATSLLILGTVAAVGLLAILAPPLTVALLLFAAAAKANPVLSAVPIDLTVITAAGVLLAMARRAMRPGGLPPLPAATIFAAGLATLIVLSVLWTPGVGIGFQRAQRFETLTMTAFAAPFLLVRSRAELRQLAIGIVGLALAVALTAVSTGQANQPLILAGGNEIELALYSALGLFAAIYLAFIDRAARVVSLVIAAVVFIPTIVAAGSRGVLTGTTLALVALAGFLIARARQRGLVLAGVVVGFALLVFAAPTLAGQAGDKYSRVLSGGSDALGIRPRLLSDAWDIALSHPMGIGVGGFPARTGVEYPHNVLLEVAAEQGVIGFALLMALFLASARALFKVPRGPQSPEAILAATLFVLLVIESMFSDTYTQNRILWFALGLGLALPGMSDVRRSRAMARAG